MPHLERIYHRPPTAWGRFTQALRSYTVGPLTLKDPELARKLGWGGGPVASGVPVTETSALTYAAVWQAVSLIAGDVGSLPLLLYKRDKDGGKTRYTDHPLYHLLHDAPNPEMSAMVWRETQQAHLLTWGNAYAEIERDAAGRPVGIWPLPPPRVTPFRESGRMRYRVAGESGRDVILEARDMLHVPGLGFDGLVGYSVIHQARESLGLLAAAERFGATFFGNGTTFGGALTHPKVLGVEGAKNLRASVEGFHKGADKAHRFLVLEEGMSFTQFGVQPNDAQFLETRQFQIAEVARWFNLPLHKLREMEHSSVRANIEQEALDYYVSTLRPWLCRWEQELRRKLISPLERNIQHIEFLLEGVLRGDQKSRYDAYAVGRQWGWLSPNEIRALENLNPIPDGDKYLSPSNMVPADRLNDVIDKQTAPTPAPVAPPAADDDEDDEAQRQAIAVLVARVEAQTATIVDLQTRHEQAVTLASQAEATTGALKAEIAELQREIEDRRASYTSLSAEHEKVKGQRDEAESALSAMTDKHHAAVAHADANAQRAEAAETETAGVRAELAAAVARVAEAESAHVAALAAVEAQRAEAERAATAAAEQATATEQRAAAAESTVAALRAELETSASKALEADTLHVAERDRLTALVAESDAQRAGAVAALEKATEATAEAERARDDALKAATEAAERATAAENAATDATEAWHAAELDRAAHAGQLSKLITAQRTVVVDALQRLVRRESEKARSKRATPEKLRAWAASFYEPHEADLWVEALRAPVAVHLLLIGSDRPADEVTRALVDAHFETSKAQMVAVAASDAEDYHRALDTTLTRWETQRAVTLADEFVREEIGHVRAI